MLKYEMKDRYQLSEIESDPYFTEPFYDQPIPYEPFFAKFQSCVITFHTREDRFSEFSQFLEANNYQQFSENEQYLEQTETSGEKMIRNEKTVDTKGPKKHTSDSELIGLNQ